MLLQERLTFTDTVWRTDKELFPDRSREQIFTGLSDRYAKNIVGPAWLLPVRSDGPAYFDMSVNLEILLHYIPLLTSIKWKYLAATELMNNSVHLLPHLFKNLLVWNY
jgi:hypothetical protein